MTDYPVRIVDIHGVMHGAWLDAYTAACTPPGRLAPYGNSVDDPVGRILERHESATGRPCPICYPKGA